MYERERVRRFLAGHFRGHDFVAAAICSATTWTGRTLRACAAVTFIHKLAA